MRIRRIIDRHLTFSRSERLIIIYFMVIILAMLVFQNFIVDLFAHKKQQELLKQHQLLVEKMKRKQDSLRLNYAGEVTEDEEIYTETEFFYFNPNTINYDEWLQLGVTSNIAKNIVKYIANGGKFYKKEDLLKIYGFSESQFEVLSPYIVFENKKGSIPYNETTIEYALSPFNPNTISESEWIAMGVPDYIVKRIINYISKGGSFKQSEDLLKIYGFREVDYQRLESYVIIEVNNNEVVQEQFVTSGEISSRDINSITKNDLLQLQFSTQVTNNILNYRNKLGGFYSTTQLLEVWNIDKEKVSAIFSDFYVDTTLIKRIRINTASLDELKNHPYISDELADAIILYRNKTGKIYSIYEVQKAGYISKKSFEKLAHYLEL